MNGDSPPHLAFGPFGPFGHLLPPEWGEGPAPTIRCTRADAETRSQFENGRPEARFAFANSTTVSRVRGDYAMHLGKDSVS